MKDIIRFEKVSESNFVKELISAFGVDETAAKEIFRELPLPRRATVGSAGYDFFSPVDLNVAPGETITIPTGIRAKMRDDCVLMLFPRSGLGFKYRMQLNNTVGIIDSDYYYSDNEGHIFVRITNDTNQNKELQVSQFSGFVQGIFIPYLLTEDDSATMKRNGGFGSTTR
ncbi:MAG: deoxyuridine 5'-triphosphate nucleotidohydrolase [Clostridiales bacterium]|nr:deoxyuridine 5'-triphosphate nucleotidohydrolase [Clostridiales bacterium]